MDEVFYVDAYFFLNFCMDGISLVLAAWILAERTKLRRVLFGAAFGGLGATLLFFLPASPLWRLAALFVLFPAQIFITFGKKRRRRFLSLMLFVVASSLFLGGAAEAIYDYALPRSAAHRVTLGVFLVVVFLGAGCFALFGRGMDRRMKSRVVNLSVFYRDRRVDLCGLVDSGSFLREPTTLFPVIILKAPWAKTLCDQEEWRALMTGESNEGLFAIPVQSAGGNRMLFGFHPQEVRLYSGKGKKAARIKDVIVALDFSSGGFAGCPCLVPLEAI